MPTSIDSRCSVSIPFGATGEDSELCGADTTQSCENCGVICTSCAETFPCPLISDGKHVFLAPQQLTSNPTPEPEPIIIKGHSGGPDGKWDEVQAIQHQPFIYVEYNGSPWAEETDDEITRLLEVLSHYRLDPYWLPGYTVNPCSGIENPEWDRWDNSAVDRFIDGPRIYEADGVVDFGGNFLRYSHAFSIHTNHQPTIAVLIDAIEKNAHIQERAPERVIYVDAFAAHAPWLDAREATHSGLGTGVPAWVDNKSLLWEAMGG